MVVTITNLVDRVFTASLIGIYTFVELFLSFLVALGVLKVVERKSKSAKEKEPEDHRRNPEETKSIFTIENENEPFLQEVEAIQMKTRVNLDIDGEAETAGDRCVEREDSLQVEVGPERESEVKKSKNTKKTRMIIKEELS